MIKKYIYGDPIETDAVIKEIPVSKGNPSYGTISTRDGFSFTYHAAGGYRLWSGRSQPRHQQTRISLYQQLHG